MFAQLTIILTIAFAMIVNARPSSFETQLSDERVEMPPEEENYSDGYPAFDERTEKWRYFEGSNSLDPVDAELAPSIPEIERLPVPEPQVMKGPAYKKTGTNYYMTLCHFKICNMGRKRDTRYFHSMDLLEKLRQKADANSVALTPM